MSGRVFACSARRSGAEKKGQGEEKWEKWEKWKEQEIYEVFEYSQITMYTVARNIGINTLMLPDVSFLDSVCCKRI